MTISTTHQTAHHLFPQVDSWHLPALTKIVVEDLKPTDFYLEKHRTVFRCFVGLFKKYESEPEFDAALTILGSDYRRFLLELHETGGIAVSSHIDNVIQA